MQVQPPAFAQAAFADGPAGPAAVAQQQPPAFADGPAEAAAAVIVRRRTIIRGPEPELAPPSYADLPIAEGECRAEVAIEFTRTERGRDSYEDSGMDSGPPRYEPTLEAHDRAWRITCATLEDKYLDLHEHTRVLGNEVLFLKKKN